MDSLVEVNNLTLKYPDGFTVALPKWFSNQYLYFRDMMEDIGEVEYDDDGNEYKCLEIDLAYNPQLLELLSKRVLLILLTYWDVGTTHLTDEMR